MKKSKKFLLVFSLISLGLVSCGEENNPPVEETKSYAIKTSKTNLFEVNVKDKGIEGEEITFTINLISSLRDFNEQIVLKNVEVNNEILREQNGFYTFTMPGKDVLINYDYEINECLEADAGMNFNFISNEISREGDHPYLDPEQTFYINFGSSRVLANMDGDGYLLSVDVVTFNDEGVLTGITKGANRLTDSVYISEASVTLDLTSLTNTEEFYLGIIEDDRVLLKHLKVRDYEEALSEETMEVSVTLDVSRVSSNFLDGDVRIMYGITDYRHRVYGACFDQDGYSEYVVNQDKYTITLNEDSYYIYLAYGKVNEYNVYAYYPLTNNNEERPIFEISEENLNINIVVTDPKE